MALGCRSETMPFDYRMARTLKGEGHAVLDGLRVLHAIHAFREAAASFRPLTAAERGSFREFRLRFVAARGGETLAQLLTRANAATWSTEMVAVANGLGAGTPLRGGELLKVPRAEPYRPR